MCNKADEKHKRVAILDLDAKNAPKTYADIIRDILEINLYKSKTFEILERNQINLLLKEQKFHMTECTDTTCAVQIGKILSADLVVIGSLSKISEYTLSMKLVDVKNGTIIIADTERANTDADLDVAANKLIQRVVRNISLDDFSKPSYKLNEKQYNNPIDFGIYYRYGLIQNMEIPTIHVPAKYPEPITMTADKIDTTVMEAIIAPNIGINNYIKLRPNFKGSWGFNGKTNSINNTNIENESGSEKYYADFKSREIWFYGIGTGLSILFEYSFYRLIPYAGFGFGYSHFWNKGNYSMNNNSPVIDASYYYSGFTHTYHDSYNITIDKHSNIIYAELEIGFSVFITEKIGLTFSGIYNYTIYGNLFHNVKIRKSIGYGSDPNLIPSEYRDLDQKIDTSSFDDKRLAPILYLQVGVVYKL